MEQETENADQDCPLDLKVVQEESEFPCSNEPASLPSESKDVTKPEPPEEPKEELPTTTTTTAAAAAAADDDGGGDGGNNSPLRASPEPSCAICLGQLENKSFTDSCFHPFCFNCLMEWSKVKAECPLCKQRFKSIVYNVRSNEDYDLYNVTRSSAESSWQSDDGSRRFRYSSTLTSERIQERRQLIMRNLNIERQSEFLMHRFMYAPHTVNYMSALSASSRRPSDTGFRLTIYEERLWAQTDAQPQTKVRDTSPVFYRQNQACTHRLIPWLNRELMALLINNEGRVMFVLDLIMALIMRYEIRSSEFYSRIEPYFGERTNHFIHEFYTFASSVHDMEEYDRHVTYQRIEPRNRPVIISSPESEEIICLSSNDEDSTAVAGPSTAPSTSGSRSHRYSSSSNSAGVKLFLRRNQKNDSWNLYSPAYSTVSLSPESRVRSIPSSPECSFHRNFNYSSPEHSVNLDFISSPEEPIIRSPEHSASGSGTTFKNRNRIEIEDIASDDDDEGECVIVTELKPKWLRTPEIIDITNSSDEGCKKVETPTYVETPVPSSPEAPKPEFSSGLDLVIKAIQMNEANDEHPTTSHSSFEPISDKTMSSSSSTATSSRDRDHRSRDPDFSKQHHSGETEKKKKYRKHPSSAERQKKRHHFNSAFAVDNPRECSSSSRSCSRDQPGTSNSSKKNDFSRGEPSYKHNYYSDSTDVSDYKSSKQKRRKRNPSKLKSVVAHVSGESSHRNDSSQHCSHSRKHKDKHKKKRKHEKHKCHKHSHSKEPKKEKDDC